MKLKSTAQAGNQQNPLFYMTVSNLNETAEHRMSFGSVFHRNGAAKENGRVPV
jgi:hypothetical protein